MSRFATSVLVAIVVLGATGVEAQSVTRRTFLVLNDVQKLMEAERYTEARTRLEELARNTRDNPYDFALASRYLAHTSVVLDDPASARKALQAGLANPGLPDDLRADLSHFYGTVLLGDQDYAAARTALEEWLALTESPRPNQLFPLAYANFMSGKVTRAEPLIARAISETKTPNASWYQLHYRILFDLKRYDTAGQVLQGMIVRDPANKGYWRLLASHYLQLERSNQGLAAMMSAHAIGVITDKSDFAQIVSLYSYIDAPEKGARLMTQWLEENRLDQDPERLKQLGNLWLLARERDHAIAVLREAARLAPDGHTYETLGRTYFEEERWEEAYGAYRKALNYSDLDEPLRISLLAGVSAFNAGRYTEARESLAAAGRAKKFRAHANSLIRQMEGK